MSDKISDLTYEKGIEEIESIVRRLEEGSLNLDDSLVEFQKGVELYRHCNNILNNIEGKINIILDKGKEGIIEKEFELNE